MFSNMREWQEKYLQDATTDRFGIPFCPTVIYEIPKKLISWEEAHNCHDHNAWVHFYLDDSKFTKTWNDPEGAIELLSHFKGIITPDYSTYADFPIALKKANTFRMRAFGYLAAKRGLGVINNLRWGDSNTYDFSFSGLPHNSTLAIGTVGGNPRSLENRERFNSGLMAAVEELSPHTLLIYGSSKYPIFTELKEKGIYIITYQGHTASVFESRRSHV